MIWIALCGVYLLGYALAFLRIAGQLAWHWVGQRNADRYAYRSYATPPSQFWFWAISCAVFLASVWPLSLPVAYFLAQATRGGGLFYIPTTERERIQKARIKELEEAAGIRG